MMDTYTMRVRLNIFLVSLSLLLGRATGAETTGQKAHFSLKDTPGSFSVHATKMLAKVSSKADSVKVIVKPGMAEYPLVQGPTQKPLVHVVSPAIVRPVGGWNYFNMIGKKRSVILNKTMGNPHSKPLKHTSSSDKVVLEQHTEGGRIRTKENVKGGESHGSSIEVSSKRKERKRSVSDNERRMEVKGGTGKLSVHVDRNGTKVTTTTAGMKVFIKNPSPSNGIQRNTIVNSMWRTWNMMPGFWNEDANGEEHNKK